MAQTLPGRRYQLPADAKSDRLLDSAGHAQAWLCIVARIFQFMDSTRLRPSRGYSRAFPKGDSKNMIPGMDHGSIWHDPDTVSTFMSRINVVFLSH